MERPISQLHHKSSLDDNEYLIRFRVAVPDKFSLDLGELELDLVHLSNDLWGPLVLEQAQLFSKYNFFNGHLLLLPVDDLLIPFNQFNQTRKFRHQIARTGPA
jgi:hypothetical protein